jgi:hypothetical protein
MCDINNIHVIRVEERQLLMRCCLSLGSFGSLYLAENFIASTALYLSSLHVLQDEDVQWRSLIPVRTGISSASLMTLLTSDHWKCCCSAITVVT